MIDTLLTLNDPSPDYHLTSSANAISLLLKKTCAGPNYDNFKVSL